MNFIVIGNREWFKSEGKNVTYLKIDYWDDYDFCTQFSVKLFDDKGVGVELGDVKIGYQGQPKDTDFPTYKKLDQHFQGLDDSFFSLGQSVEYYKKLNDVSEFSRKEYLEALNDLVQQPNLIDIISKEEVFRHSLIRDVSLTAIKGQFKNVLEGGNELTPFNFKFKSLDTERVGGIELKFDVEVGSKPSTNLHAIIGRNGVGKTTLINSMIASIMNSDADNTANFYDLSRYSEKVISKDYFSALFLVSFSAFDTFKPPLEQNDPTKGTCFYYLGLRNLDDNDSLKNFSELRGNCLISLINCFNNKKKRRRWINAIDKLGTDSNFFMMNLKELLTIYRDTVKEVSELFKLDSKNRENKKNKSEYIKNKFGNFLISYLSRMSSGHAIVFMTITRLVEKVDEKTLILFDEPETHLHPPLLSALIRALSDLLVNCNAVSIIATHSPVVLQEVPRDCVWKLFRRGKSMEFSRPKIETFGESVSDLTTEVFGLEVTNSGFHDLLQNSVSEGKNYQQILEEFNHQIGFEGRALLKVMITERDKDNQ
ncbi:AAA family ATPase [Acinetobacter baumannii]|uniref:AAA family ATPase n=1 Tax=Acinetobacter baumannii TaxID=470 RepID=UPI0024BBF30F|nr:AAA family ATPase [Acinetobacter baumannii]WFT03756.1 AAA family ATPase [Acinetobacter baumannii]